ncbi:MAG TPA: nuclear transport factor 2 family protein [Baekduia sp.]|nr:nuclear transport factor 2 family protein [Baekduia sp.]
MDYTQYIALFNDGDDEAFVNSAFVEDCVVHAGERELRGRGAVLAYLSSIHDGVRAVMRPQRIVEHGDDVLAEVDVDFHASTSRPDFPFGAMGPGDLTTVKCLASYGKREGGFAEVKIANWPPEHGVTKLPRLGAHVSQVAAFYAYVAAFSAGDTQRFPGFYTEDIVLDLGSLPPMQGKAVIAGFYDKMKQALREQVTIHNLLVNDTAIAAETTARFTAVADAPEFDVVPMRKGDVVELPGLIYYTLRDGLISHINVLRRVDPVKLA